MACAKADAMITQLADWITKRLGMRLFRAFSKIRAEVTTVAQSGHSLPVGLQSGSIAIIGALPAPLKNLRGRMPLLSARLTVM